VQRRLARNELAITPKFKPVITHVQTWEVPLDALVQRGTIGPQSANGIGYSGGRSQIHLLNPADQLRLKPIGPPRLIGPLKPPRP